MATFPRITLVTPSFNQAQYLEQTIRSVVTQGYPNLEYMIMDGGSTDGSDDIIRRHVSDLAYWQSRPDGGQAAAIAEGFSRGTGDILGWLNSDDVLLPGCLSAIAEAFTSSPECGVVSGRCVYVNAAGTPVSVSIPVRRSRVGMLFWGAGICQMSTFWRSDAYRRVGGIDPSFTFSMDYDLFVRLRAQCIFKMVDKYIAAFRLHGGSKTSRLLETSRVEGRRVFDAQFGRYPLLYTMTRYVQRIALLRRTRNWLAWRRDRLIVEEMCKSF